MQVFKNAKIWVVRPEIEWMDANGDIWLDRLPYNGDKVLLRGGVQDSYLDFVIMPRGVIPQMGRHMEAAKKVTNVVTERKENIHANKVWRKPEICVVKTKIYQRGNDVVVE